MTASGGGGGGLYGFHRLRFAYLWLFVFNPFGLGEVQKKRDCGKNQKRAGRLWVYREARVENEVSQTDNNDVYFAMCLVCDGISFSQDRSI